jgi:hypothetical protein
MGFAALVDVSKELGLSLERLEEFCSTVDASMPNENAYHNKLHVADVTQMMFRLTCEGGKDYTPDGRGSIVVYTTDERANRHFNLADV